MDTHLPGLPDIVSLEAIPLVQQHANVSKLVARPPYAKQLIDTPHSACLRLIRWRGRWPRWQRWRWGNDEVEIEVCVVAAFVYLNGTLTEALPTRCVEDTLTDRKPLDACRLAAIQTVYTRS